MNELDEHPVHADLGTLAGLQDLVHVLDSAAPYYADNNPSTFYRDQFVLTWRVAVTAEGSQVPFWLRRCRAILLRRLLRNRRGGRGSTRLWFWP